jgi:hypothetical protein
MFSHNFFEPEGGDGEICCSGEENSEYFARILSAAIITI